LVKDLTKICSITFTLLSIFKQRHDWLNSYFLTPLRRRGRSSPIPLEEGEEEGEEAALSPSKRGKKKGKKQPYPPLPLPPKGEKGEKGEKGDRGGRRRAASLEAALFSFLLPPPQVSLMFLAS
jgi:hypothetical protein